MDPRTLGLLEDLLDVPAGEREATLAARCATEPTLRHEVLQLLEAHQASTGFLEPLVASGPQSIGPYRLERLLGEGCMGRVFLAERSDGAFSQKVAIKLLSIPIGDAEAIRRAEAERQFFAWLEHPNIARIIDGGSTADGQPYVIMEYVDGLRIDLYCRHHGLDVRARVKLFIQVLDAVDAAHRALIIHRDLKPSNVLVTGDGRVKLLDFGIAKSLDSRVDVATTGTGLTPLTPKYAAPEQINGEPLTTACDIYALGLLLYELLCGQAARSDGLRSLKELGELIEVAPTRPSSRVQPSALGLDDALKANWQRQLRGDLDQIVQHAIQRQPGRRYGSTRAFADDLENWLARRPINARGEAAWYRIGRFLQRHRLAASLTALALAAIIGALVVALNQAQRAELQAERALEANRFLTELISQADPWIGGSPPTLEQAIDNAAASFPASLAEQPALESDIRHAIGRAYLSLERLDAAQAQLDRAVDLRQAEGGARLAEALKSQAVVAWTAGDYAAAEQGLTAALVATDGRRDAAAERSAVLNDLGAMLSELGRNEEALAHLTEARRLGEAGTGVRVADRLVTLGNLASVLHNLGRLEEANAIYTRAEQQLHAEGGASLNLAANLSKHAAVMSDLGKIEEAQGMLERSVEMIRAIRGRDHPRQLSALGMLAQVYALRDNHPAAASAIDEALRYAYIVHSPPHPQIGHLHYAAARIALVGSRPADALEHAEQALQIYRDGPSVEAVRVERMEQTRDEARRLLGGP